MNKFIPTHQQRQTGATLMEVLITMVVILFGLVGLSQLFLKASRMTEEAYDRHRALVMANQMAESMRSMIRLKDTAGAGGAKTCPTAANMPTAGILTNEQLMRCFVELSQSSSSGGSLGQLRGESTVSEPAQTKGGALDCASPCDMREMALWMLNSWTEALAGYSQTAPGPATNIYSAKGFTARGCINEISDSTYRVRVFWRSDDSIPPDADENYCGMTADHFLRYTFVDVSLSSAN